MEIKIGDMVRIQDWSYSLRITGSAVYPTRGNQEPWHGKPMKVIGFSSELPTEIPSYCDRNMPKNNLILQAEENVLFFTQKRFVRKVDFCPCCKREY